GSRVGVYQRRDLVPALLEIQVDRDDLFDRVGAVVEDAAAGDAHVTLGVDPGLEAEGLGRRRVKRGCIGVYSGPYGEVPVVGQRPHYADGHEEPTGEDVGSEHADRRGGRGRTGDVSREGRDEDGLRRRRVEGGGDVAAVAQVPFERTILGHGARRDTEEVAVGGGQSADGCGRGRVGVGVDGDEADRVGQRSVADVQYLARDRE